nr:hypothetical protein [Pseudomonas sp. PDM03]
MGRRWATGSDDTSYGCHPRLQLQRLRKNHR